MGFNRLEQISFRSWLNSLKSLDLAFDCNKPTEQAMILSGKDDRPD
jgi:hypothetical protein